MGIEVRKQSDFSGLPAAGIRRAVSVRWWRDQTREWTPHCQENSTTALSVDFGAGQFGRLSPTGSKALRSWQGDQDHFTDDAHWTSRRGEQSRITPAEGGGSRTRYHKCLSQTSSFLEDFLWEKC